MKEKNKGKNKRFKEKINPRKQKVNSLDDKIDSLRYAKELKEVLRDIARL